MSSNFNAVTDRTISDVNRVKELVIKGLKNMTNDELIEFTGYMKGRVVASDFNRIDAFLNKVRQVLNQQGIITTLPSLPTNFADGDVLSQTYINNLKTVLDFLSNDIGKSNIDLVNLDYVKMNALEDLLTQFDTRVVFEIGGTTETMSLSQLSIGISIYNILSTRKGATKVTVYGSYNDFICEFNKQSPYNQWYVQEIDLSNIYHDIGNTVPKLAFRNLDKLVKITLPECLVSIGEDAFYMCTSLEKIIIPSNVTTIYNEAFSTCTKLKEVILPNSITTIGFAIFSACTSLETLTYNGTMAQWNAINKNANWKGSNTPLSKIVCTDGTITL